MSSSEQKDLLTWCDDLHQVKGNVSQLQATLNQILTKAPSLEQFKQLVISMDDPVKDDPRSIAMKNKNLLLSAQLKVAVRLKHLYDHGLLPSLLALSKINFKSSKSDKFVGYFLDYTPPSDIGDSLPEVLKKHTKPNKNIDISTYPPNLPPVSNESLLKRALTDKSFRQPSDFIESATADDFNRSHNAKFSLKGRSLLELILIDLLEAKFPDLHEDDTYLLRYKLLSKHILTKFTFGYHLVDNYRFNMSNQIDLSDKLVIFSNIFTSYVAALKLDGYPHDEIEAWLRKLYDPIMADLGKSIKSRPLEKFAVSEIDFLFKSTTDIHTVSPDHVDVKYEELESDPFVAKLTIDNETVAIGTSSVSFEEAKERAACEALKDKTKLDQILTVLIDSHKDSISKNSEREDDSYSPKLEAADANQYEGVPHINHENAVISLPAKSPSSNGNSAATTPVFASQITSKSTPQPYGAPLQPHSSLPVAPYNLVPIDPKQRFGVDKRAKATLEALLTSRNLSPNYKYQKTGSNFQATIAVNNVVMGVGIDSNKKTATQKAAMEALSNSSALQVLGISI